MIRFPIKMTKKGFIIGFCLWTLWAMFYALILSIGAHLLYGLALISSLMSYYPLALLSVFFIAFCKTYRIENHFIIGFVIVHFFVAILFSMLWLAIDYGFNLLLFGPIILRHRPLDSVGTFQFYNGVIIYALLAGIVYTSESFKRYRETELKTSQLETLTREAELKALKSQVNPHFLFNTLNTIFALIDSNAEKAKATVTKLSDLLRYSLAGFKREFVTLEEEINSAKTYLSIERERFGDRLRVQFEIDGAAYRWNVPSMFLQPLIENAVKHGISNARDGGTITVRARMEGDQLQVEVRDSAAGTKSDDAPKPKSNGIGLENLRARLQRIYGEAFYFSHGPAEPPGYAVTLRFDKIGVGST